MENNETNQTIYISFNNKDSSVSSFTSYLVADLYRLGIDAVFDKTSHELEFSRIKLFLLVFSNPNAYSETCLENLVKLLEFLQKSDHHHVVVPVFYDVVVKQQMEMFEEAFAVLERSYSADQVTKWRRLLAETIELQGHEYNDEQSDESTFIEKINKDVFEKLYPTTHIGTYEVLLELQNLLCKQPWGFRSIGILGEDGIGKTTLMKAAVRRMSGCYDASRLIIAYNEIIIDLLSNEDFEEIPMEEFDLNNQVAEPNHRPKRILIAVDDVRNFEDVDTFLDEFKRFGPGSLLMITSTSRKVLEECKVNEIYELKGLNDEDAMKLFTRCLFGEDVIIEDKLLKLLANPIEHCRGNPSSLRSFAEMIKRDKTIEMQTDFGRIFRDAFTNTKKNKPLLCFQVTRDSFTITLDKSLLFSAQHNYQSDLEKLPELDLASRFVDSMLTDLRDLNLHHSMQQSFFCATSHNDLKNLQQLDSLPSHAFECLPGDQKILPFAQHFHRKQLVLVQGLARQLNKLREGYKGFPGLSRIKSKQAEVEENSEGNNIEQSDFRDHTSSERIIQVTDHVEHPQDPNLSGCFEIKIFPKGVQTIRGLNLEDTRIKERQNSKLVYNKKSTSTLLELTKKFRSS